jgi:putative membrane protein
MIMFYSDHMNGWGWVLMVLAMVAFWGLLISVVFTRPWGSRPGSPAQAPAAPEQLLAERLARGDIDEPEYHSRLAALRGTPQS